MLALIVAVFGYSVLHGSGGNSQGTVDFAGTPEPTFAPEVKFVSPLNGDTVSNPVTVKVAAGGVRIAPASEPVDPQAGHFRILLDAPALVAGQPPPAEQTLADLTDAAHVLELPPLSTGDHRLTVVFEKSDHIPVEPLLTDEITIHVSG
ncbi:MAG TPA: DUF4399 domain-containing protein [Dehalococcoidia bacterium]|nr:DUF4399 domain-containing protein [Dehalococcoidia bacterium]